MISDDGFVSPVPELIPKRPLVIKMAGVWLWRCYHGGWLGGSFRAQDWRDPWSCALMGATSHAVKYHSTEEGEVVPWPGSGPG